MTRGRLAIHAHFYQPLRADPFSGALPREPAAAPFHDWNARIDAECYRPNVERGNVGRVSFDLGPTLAGWMERESPATLAGFVAADRALGRAGGAMAQTFHHSILPLASARDRATEVAWGLADFEHRFGRPARGLWLPETAVDLATLRLAAAAGIRYTILAPWQAADANLDTRGLYRVDLGGGASIVAVFYDARLSAAVSFDPAATADAGRFAREAVAPRLASGPFAGGVAPLIVIATDGELYGHHLEFRDLFLEHLVGPVAPGAPSGAAAPAALGAPSGSVGPGAPSWLAGPAAPSGPGAPAGPAAPSGLAAPAAPPDPGFDVVDLATVVASADPAGLPPMGVVDRTSWSCHHGVARWTHECPDARDGRWKGPLRAALERLAGAIDALTEAELAALPGTPDAWAARDASVGLVLGSVTEAGFVAGWLGAGAPAPAARRFLALMLAQRWRLAMFASDGWFWEDPIRTETKQVLRSAARAARIVDALLGSRLEARLIADLRLLVSPSTGLDGGAIYAQALEEVGQPV